MCWWNLFFVQELEDLRKSKTTVFQNIEVDESNILAWKGLIVPVSVPSYMKQKIRPTARLPIVRAS